MAVKDVAMKAVDAFNRHDASAFAALYTDDAVAPDPQYAEPLHGREAIRKDIEDFFRAFPDVQARLASEVLVNGNTAAFEMEVAGTHNGPLATPEGAIPPTGRRVQMTGGRFISLNEQGLINSCRRYYDLAGIMAQLGVG